MNKIVSTRYREIRLALFAVFIVFSAHLAFMLMSGKNLLSDNPYNSYTLQANAWLQGRLDLGQDYPWLELAIYQEKFYVSFPVFPSYIMLPFAAIFGVDTPDSIIAFAVMMLGVCYAVKIACFCKLSDRQSIFLTVFLYCANNLWQVMLDGGVWAFAQNTSVTLTLMSLYYGLSGKKGKACFFLCAAVGCRPFQILYFPLVCYLLLQTREERRKSDQWKWLICYKNVRLLPAVLLAVSYMLLNYVRFGNPLEFGHHYLPEFTESEYGQFSLQYLRENLYSLVRLPQFDSETWKLIFPRFDGVNIFIVFPIITVYAVYLIHSLIKRKPWQEKLFHNPLLLILSLLLLHIICLCLHKTMGGAHFGHRYIVDLTPAIYLALIISEDMPWKNNNLFETGGNIRITEIFMVMLMFFGLLINFSGILTY